MLPVTGPLILILPSGNLTYLLNMTIEIVDFPTKKGGVSEAVLAIARGCADIMGVTASNLESPKGCRMSPWKPRKAWRSGCTTGGSGGFTVFH